MAIRDTLREFFRDHGPDDIAKKLTDVGAEIASRTQLLADARASANAEGALAYLRGESPPDRTRIRQGEDALEELRELHSGLVATLERTKAEHWSKRKAELYAIIDAKRKLRFKLYKDLYATTLIAARHERTVISFEPLAAADAGEAEPKLTHFLQTEDVPHAT